jgi:hypothetical protein
MDMTEATRVQVQDLLLAEVEITRQELETLRAGIRYRLGEVLLQAFPLSWRSLRVLPRLYILYRTYRRNQSAQSRSALRSAPGLTTAARECKRIVFSRAPVALDADTWSTDDPAALALRLDTAPVQQLVLRAVTESIARRLGRLQLQGCQIIWWPEAPESGSTLELYTRALASECRSGAMS